MAKPTIKPTTKQKQGQLVNSANKQPKNNWNFFELSTWCLATLSDFTLTTQYHAKDVGFPF